MLPYRLFIISGPRAVPFALRVLDLFICSVPSPNVTLQRCSLYEIPLIVFPFSLFLAHFLLSPLSDDSLFPAGLQFVFSLFH